MYRYIGGILALTLVACAGAGDGRGFDRGYATEVVKRDVFASGTRWGVTFSAHAGRIECRTRTYSWASNDFTRELSCVQEMDRLGAVESVSVGLRPVDISALTRAEVRAQRGRTFSVTINERSFNRRRGCDLRVNPGGRGSTYYGGIIALWLPSLRFDEVTGVVETGENTRTVEFRYHHDRSVLGNLASQCSPLSLPPHGAQTAESMLRNFDDGWRVESTEW